MRDDAEAWARHLEHLDPQRVADRAWAGVDEDVPKETPKEFGDF